MTKKCLVIGASSFIGVYVVDALLDAGYEVVGTGRNRRFAGHYRKLGVEYIPLDLNDPSGTGALPTDFDFVAHLAGRLPANSAFDLSTEDDAAEYIRTNALGTALLLEWARKNGVRRIVSTTSYADVQNSWSASEPVREDWPRDFRLDGDHAAYVISKNASADLLFYYNEQYGMRNCVFRLPPVYGCGPHGSLRVNGAVKKSGIGLFVDKAKVGEDITVFGDADAAVRDIVYVKDVAQAFVKAGERVGLWPIQHRLRARGFPPRAGGGDSRSLFGSRWHFRGLRRRNQAERYPALLVRHLPRGVRFRLCSCFCRFP